MSAFFAFIHAFLLCDVYLTRNISEVDFINILPFLIETIIIYLLFTLKLFLWTLTDESTGTVSAVLMIILFALYLLMRSPEFLCIVLPSAFLFTYRMDRTLLSRNHAFNALGRGATPATWSGFIRITVLEFFRIDKHNPMAHTPGMGFLTSLPARAGPRPNVIGIAPSRQEDCLPSAGPLATHASFVSELEVLTAAHPTKLSIKPSFLEGAIPALFAKQPTSPSFVDSGSEIAHPHERDGNMHLVLHPADPATVINAGWGERHPLCANDKKWWVTWHYAHGVRPCAPESLVLVYAPLNAEHKKVVMQCVRAAASYGAGVEMVEGDSTFGSESSDS